MTRDLEYLFTLLNTGLLMQSPVLSGNMQNGIKIHKIDGNEVTIVIEAPFYDEKVWERTGAIVLTGAIVNGKTDYAELVNKYGGFGTGNKSMHWVNRCCLDAVSIVASEIGAEVINELEL